MQGSSGDQAASRKREDVLAALRGRGRWPSGQSMGKGMIDEIKLKSSTLALYAAPEASGGGLNTY
jgi:hypothetical protein